MTTSPIHILFLLEACFNAASTNKGPEIFKFTSQPVTQTVNPGGSVTLSCEATGRSDITYSWYRLDTDFIIPPSDADLIGGENNSYYVVQAADVDDTGEERMFQCKATAGTDIIISSVATVLYKFSDNIRFDGSGSSYDSVTSIPNDLKDPDVYLYRLQCNPNIPYFDDVIKNGEPYDVQWFKTGDTGRVEDSHDNMWTYYNNKDLNSYRFDVAGNLFSISTVKQYDLVIFNVRTSDAGTYSCKAVSRVNKLEVLLGSTDLNVGTENTGLAIYPKEIATGYMVMAVDRAEKIRSEPRVRDEVLLMCGVACRTSSGSLDPQYQWKDSSGNVIANAREHIVTVSSTGTVSYTCEILNSECTSKLSSAVKSVSMNVTAADFDPSLQFTFSKSPPEYMWYDTSDNSKSHDPFEIGCEGSYSSGNSDEVLYNSVLRMPDTVASSGEDVVYDFSSSFTSDKTGVYQCVMFNSPDKSVLYQQTTTVIISTSPSSTITSTILSVSSGNKATFTCTVGGYPLESVTISGPNNLNLNCLTTQTTGDVSCSSSDQSSYVVNVQNFILEYSGDYTCTVNTKLYKSDYIAAVEYSAEDHVALSFESTTTLTTSKNPANKGTAVILTCTVKGNPAPIDPVLTKTVNGSSSNVPMTCSGTNTKICEKSFSSVEFTDSGDYVCSGENTINGVKKKSSSQLTLEIVRSTEVFMSNETLFVLTSGMVYVLCTIVGKPLVDISAVSWSHETLADLDLSKNVTTVKGLQDNYTLVSILFIVNPLIDYSGSFKCNVQLENGQVVTKSVEVLINDREFLDAPDAKVTHNGQGKAIEQYVEMSITCEVKGFPRSSATLVYENLIDGTQRRTISVASSVNGISPTLTEFEFELLTNCDYSQYKFICETKTTKLTDQRVLKNSTSLEGPIVTGCQNDAEMNTEALIASGVALFLFLIIILGIIYIVHLRRNLFLQSTIGNVAYLNRTPEKLGGRSSGGTASNVNTAVQSPSTPNLHVYNDVVSPTLTTGDSPYNYARSEDTVRNNVRAPIYSNHELT